LTHGSVSFADAVKKIFVPDLFNQYQTSGEQSGEQYFQGRNLPKFNEKINGADFSVWWGVGLRI
jgi:hypothetical protein